MITIIDTNAVPVTGLNWRNLKILTHQQHFFLPESINLSSTKTVRANASRAALVNWTVGNLTHIVAKGTIALLEAFQIFCMMSFIPFFHTLGHCHFPVSGDELIKRHLLRSNRVKAVIIPLCISQIHEHFPAIFLISSPVVERYQPVNSISRPPRKS